eukprot:scaffold58805_cov25-Tisochrysis_lutea.AAC.6
MARASDSLASISKTPSSLRNAPLEMWPHPSGSKARKTLVSTVCPFSYAGVWSATPLRSACSISVRRAAVVLLLYDLRVGVLAAVETDKLCCRDKLIEQARAYVGSWRAHVAPENSGELAGATGCRGGRRAEQVGECVGATGSPLTAAGRCSDA